MAKARGPLSLFFKIDLIHSLICTDICRAGRSSNRPHVAKLCQALQVVTGTSLRNLTGVPGLVLLTRDPLARSGIAKVFIGALTECPPRSVLYHCSYGICSEIEGQQRSAGAILPTRDWQVGSQHLVTYPQHPDAEHLD